MAPDLLHFHAERVARMLADLQLEPVSLTLMKDGTIVDDASRRALTPPLHNQTLGEGLISAIKIASAIVSMGVA